MIVGHFMRGTYTDRLKMKIVTPPLSQVMHAFFRQISNLWLAMGSSEFDSGQQVTWFYLQLVAVLDKALLLSVKIGYLYIIPRVIIQFKPTINLKNKAFLFKFIFSWTTLLSNNSQSPNSENEKPVYPDPCFRVDLLQERRSA